jgi:hypothetical protein
MLLYMSCKADVYGSFHAGLGVRGTIVQMNTNCRQIQTWDACSNRVPEHASNSQTATPCLCLCYVCTRPTLAVKTIVFTSHTRL